MGHTPDPPCAPSPRSDVFSHTAVTCPCHRQFLQWGLWRNHTCSGGFSGGSLFTCFLLSLRSHPAAGTRYWYFCTTSSRAGMCQSEEAVLIVACHYRALLGSLFTDQVFLRACSTVTQHSGKQQSISGLELAF